MEHEWRGRKTTVKEEEKECVWIRGLGQLLATSRRQTTVHSTDQRDANHALVGYGRIVGQVLGEDGLRNRPDFKRIAVQAVLR